MNDVEQLFWDPLTTGFVDEAILSLDSETLVDAIRGRIETLLSRQISTAHIHTLSNEISGRVGDVLVDLYGEVIDIDGMVEFLGALGTSSEEAFRRGSTLGFVESIRGKVGVIFTALAAPKPTTDILLVVHDGSQAVNDSVPSEGGEVEDVNHAISTIQSRALPVCSNGSESGLSGSKSKSLLDHSSNHDEEALFAMDEERVAADARRGGYEGAFKTYMSRAGQHKLLTREEEIRLADTIKDGYEAGSELKVLRESGPLEPEKERLFIRRIKRGEGARNTMIVSNLRLVVKIAFDYKNYGLEVDDLIQEGNIGLMKAVERFDPNKGGKLSTYAAWWIKQSIKRALANQSKTIRLPVHMVDKLSKLRRVSMAMSEELGREPTEDELSEEIGIDRKKIAQLKTASMRPASLDAEIGEDGGTTLGEIVGDGKDDASVVVANAEMLSKVLPLIEILKPRERKIIDARFGLNGQKAQTLEEVGQELGVTRERIRQLQDIALRKMQRALQKKEKEPQSPLRPKKISKNKKSKRPEEDSIMPNTSPRNGQDDVLALEERLRQRGIIY